MSFIDLRSDTVTRPTAAMRAAMASADVGDDVYGEDPTVRALEEQTAALFGHEAALFVPSGTMGNQIAVRLLVRPGEELLLDSNAHVVTYEGGGLAQHGGVQTRTVASDRGLLDPAAVAAELRSPGWGPVPTAAVAIEQTHNRGGGTVYPLATIEALRASTRDVGSALHCDGARIWNAHVASGVPLATYGVLCDTLSVCFSKGLGAPVGSAVVGSAAAVAEGRVIRRRLGGGMRQAGILAAAALYALEHHVERLADDHERARALAAACGVDPAGVDTNIVVLPAQDSRAFAARVSDDGVRVAVVGPHTVRLVTHLDIDDEAVDRAAKALAAANRAIGSRPRTTPA